MAIMDAQLDKFEAVEEILGVRISNTVSDKPKDKRQGKDVGRMGKETASKRNGSKTRVNVDDGVKTFWGTCFVCGEQGHKKDYCLTRTESDKRATAQPQRSSSAVVPSAGISTGLGSVLRRWPHRLFHKVLPAGRALLLPGNRLCRIGRFRWKPKRRKKGMLIKCRGALTYAWNILKCFVQS